MIHRLISEPHLESQHFMMFEHMEDWNDDIRPNDLDIDFTEIEFEEFLKFLSHIKIK